MPPRPASPRKNSLALRHLLATWLFLLLPLSTSARDTPWLQAPGQPLHPVNQMGSGPSACGPAALLSSLSAASPTWKKSLQRLTKPTDAQRLRLLCGVASRTPSVHQPDRTRYHPRRGITLLDLAAQANDLRPSPLTPPVEALFFFRPPTRTPQAQLHAVHQKLSHSLRQGFPPILHLQRLSWPSSHRAPRSVRSHYVSLAGLPAKLPRHSTHFEVLYLDPWGGKVRRGLLTIPPTSGLWSRQPTLQAHFPQTEVGLRDLRPDSPHLLVLSGAVGQF